MQINQAVVSAVGRHVVSYAAGGATVAAGAVAIGFSMHTFDAGQAAALTDAFKSLAAGITTIVGSIGTIASIGMAVWAASSSTTAAKAQAVVAEDPGTKIVASPALAAATPKEPAIVSSADVAVVAK